MRPRRLEWLRRSADDLRGSKIRADSGFGNVTIDLIDSMSPSTPGGIDLTDAGADIKPTAHSIEVSDELGVKRKRKGA